MRASLFWTWEQVTAIFNISSLKFKFKFKKNENKFSNMRLKLWRLTKLKMLIVVTNEIKQN